MASPRSLRASANFFACSFAFLAASLRCAAVVDSSLRPRPGGVGGAIVDLSGELKNGELFPAARSAAAPENTSCRFRKLAGPPGVIVATASAVRVLIIPLD